MKKDLTEKKIAGFGDGPASFNFQATKRGICVTSFDPIYSFSKNDIENRINEVRNIVITQMKQNMENYVWKDIKNLEELENLRMSAMKLFLSDFEKGKKQQRYIPFELPNKLNLPENTFHLGLSSHFLLMYTSLGYDFHINSISEMMRVCEEVRIFPIVDLDAEQSVLTDNVIKYFKKIYNVEILKTEYNFQKGENKLLVIKKV